MHLSLQEGLISPAAPVLTLLLSVYCTIEREIPITTTCILHRLGYQRVHIPEVGVGGRINTFAPLVSEVESESC